MRKNGFTLIEVMVVIIMIGILAAVAVPIYTGYTNKARANEGIVALGAIKTYLLEYKLSQGVWPTENPTIITDKFKELYYFDKSNITIFGGGEGNRIAIRLEPSSKFGISSNLSEPWLQLDITFENADRTNSGWSGDIMDEYADYLPPCSEPLGSS